MATTRAKKQAKKVSVPALIAAVVSILLIVAFVLAILGSNGFFTRWKNGAKSKNFSVNGSMMAYFFANAGEDVDETKEMVTEVLRYCEAAKADANVDFKDLQKKAKEDTENDVAYLKLYANYYGFADLNSFLRAMYGDDIYESDVRDACNLSNLASEYATVVRDRFLAAETQSDRDDFFKKNLATFVTAETLTYAFESTQYVVPAPNAADYEGGEESKAYKDALEAGKTPDPADYVGGEDSKAYKEDLAAAKASVKDKNEGLKKEFEDRIAACKTAEDFRRVVLDYSYDVAFNTAYNSSTTKVTEKPTDDVKNAFREEIKEKLFTAALAGETTVKVFDGDDDETTFDGVKNTLAKSCLTSLTAKLTAAEKTVTYTLVDDLGKWLFAGVKEMYGIPYEEGEKKGENAPENAVKSVVTKTIDEDSGKYEITGYIVTKTAGRDETPFQRNVGHILIKADESETAAEGSRTFDEAKEEAEKVLALLDGKAKDGIVSKEDFEAIAKEHNEDSNIFYDDVTTESSYVEEFLEWTFDAKTPGEYGLIKSTYGYHIMYYVGASENVEGGIENKGWIHVAYESIATEQLDAWAEGLTYPVTINDAYLAELKKKADERSQKDL